MNQTTLFDLKTEIAARPVQTPKSFDSSEWGTFKDSLRAPIHGWFPYPAGFSCKAVEHAIQRFSITQKCLIYDPFCGTGTTNIVAKSLGISSIGAESHPFIFFVAKTKSYWSYRLEKTLSTIREIESIARRRIVSEGKLRAEFPELVHKCFSKSVLKDLYVIREAIKSVELSKPYIDFFNLALTCILRPVANVATGWPYIAPNRKKNGKEKDVFKTFFDMVIKMFGDVEHVKKNVADQVDCRILNIDARDTTNHIGSDSVDFIFTSPPYLNNYDYADRTRLETYFFGWAKSWGEITEKIRSKLIMSATTQINRGDYSLDNLLSNDLKTASPEIASELEDKIHALADLRISKGGKKSYDILTAGYFSDMFSILSDCYRVLKKGSVFALILGDSAPYGVYVPTDVVLGELGKAIGYSHYRIEELRKRGDKWKANPQRHKVKLREAILFLTK